MNYKNIFYLTIALFLTSCGDDENKASLEDNIAGSWAEVAFYDAEFVEGDGITRSMVQSAWDNNQPPTLINRTVEVGPDVMYIDTVAKTLSWDSDDDCIGDCDDLIYTLNGNNFTLNLDSTFQFNQRGSFAFSSSGDIEYLQFDFELLQEDDVEGDGYKELRYLVTRMNYQRPR